jgi:hypothetical protein
MPAVRACVICERPLDDGRRRRRDAVTCGASCRTLLWRARRKIRQDGSVPYLDVNGDGYGSVASFAPPASHPGPTGDDRFYEQAALQDDVITYTPAERQWQSRNPGVMHPDVQQRIIDREMARRQRQAEEAASHRGLRPESPLDPSSRGSVARGAMESRRINRPADPYERMLHPGQSGPSPRHISAIEAEMIDAPWGRSTPRSSAGW